MRAIYKREVSSYFTTPIGYFLLGIFLLASGIYFVLINIGQQTASLSPLLSSCFLIFLVLIPLLTMRLLSEERNKKTDQLLLTAPVSVWQMVIAKFLAAASVFLLVQASTLVYLVVLAIHGKPPYSEIICNYIGFYLMALCFISLGLFISSITENQAVSFFFSFVATLLFMLLDALKNFDNAALNFIVDCFSINARFQDFGSGILNIAPIVFYLSFTAIFVFLTAANMERRR